MLALTAIATAEAPIWGNDLSKAVHQARENKLGFIVPERESCGNCQATKRLVNERKIPVAADTFVAADLNIDDQKTQAEFMRKDKKLSLETHCPSSW